MRRSHHSGGRTAQQPAALRASPAATGIELFYFQATVSYPASCTVNTSDEPLPLTAYVDGSTFVGGGNVSYVQGGSSTRGFEGSFLFEPGTATSHTMTVTAGHDGCSAPADTPTVTEFSADVVGVK